MIIKNKFLINLLCIATGIIIILFCAKDLYNYFNTMMNGKHCKGIITGYKRIDNNSSKKYPSFTFKDEYNKSFEATCKTSLPKNWNNTSYRYFKEGDEVKVAYFISAPTKAVILNWTSWLFYFIYMAVGILFSVVGFLQLIKRK